MIQTVLSKFQSSWEVCRLRQNLHLLVTVPGFIKHKIKENKQVRHKTKAKVEVRGRKQRTLCDFRASWYQEVEITQFLWPVVQVDFSRDRVKCLLCM